MAERKGSKGKRDVAEEYVRKQLAVMDGSAEAGIRRIGTQGFEKIVQEVMCVIRMPECPTQLQKVATRIMNLYESRQAQGYDGPSFKELCKELEPLSSSSSATESLLREAGAEK